MNIYEMIDQRDLIDFSQKYDISRNYLGETLFPNRKTNNIEAEYMRLEENGNLPTVAMVHAYDTEAAIGERIPITKMSIESLLIKKKLNMTERLQALLNHGVKNDALLEYVFDDAARLSEAVINRAELAKMEALATGKVTIKENGLDFTVDYEVPNTNKVSADWSDPSHDVLSDLRKWCKAMVSKGVRPNRAVTSDAIVEKMLQNEPIQKAIFGVNGLGILPTLDQLNSLISAHFQFTISTNDEMYATEEKKGEKIVRGNSRYFPENGFSLFYSGGGGLGTGLWGPTPEEDEQNVPWDKRTGQYVTVTQWKKPDPVSVWTKATSLFVPIIPNPNALLCATVTTEAAGK